MQTDKWLPWLLYPDYDAEQDSGLNVFFEINSYGSTKAIINMGSTFVFLVTLIGITLLERCLTLLLLRIPRWP